jgi:hypothetical protein
MGQADFSKNLRPSLFNKYLTNEPNFNQIHLAGQYLYEDATCCRVPGDGSLWEMLSGLQFSIDEGSNKSSNIPDISVQWTKSISHLLHRSIEYYEITNK